MMNLRLLKVIKSSHKDEKSKGKPSSSYTDSKFGIYVVSFLHRYESRLEPVLQKYDDFLNFLYKLKHGELKKSKKPQRNRRLKK